jgi:hypothetical protein
MEERPGRLYTEMGEWVEFDVIGFQHVGATILGHSLAVSTLTVLGNQFHSFPHEDLKFKKVRIC